MFLWWWETESGASLGARLSGLPGLFGVFGVFAFDLDLTFLCSDGRTRTRAG